MYIEEYLTESINQEALELEFIEFVLFLFGRIELITAMAISTLRCKTEMERSSRMKVKEVPLLAILTYSQTFPLNSCQYVSTIPEKKLHVTDL